MIILRTSSRVISPDSSLALSIIITDAKALCKTTDQCTAGFFPKLGVGISAGMSVAIDLVRAVA